MPVEDPPSASSKLSGPTPLSDELVQLLRCPLEHTPLDLASAELVEQINLGVSRGRVRDRLEQRVEQPIEGGLVNTSKTLLYPIRDGIPTLVQEEAIDLESFTTEITT